MAIRGLADVEGCKFGVSALSNPHKLAHWPFGFCNFSVERGLPPIVCICGAVAIYLKNRPETTALALLVAGVTRICT